MPFANPRSYDSLYTQTRMITPRVGSTIFEDKQISGIPMPYETFIQDAKPVHIYGPIEPSYQERHWDDSGTPKNVYYVSYKMIGRRPGIKIELPATMDLYITSNESYVYKRRDDKNYTYKFIEEIFDINKAYMEQLTKEAELFD